LRAPRAPTTVGAVLEVRLSGGLALRAGGEELALPASRRARGVLAFLALQPGPQARGPLAARFWPDVLDESARTSLRAALSELRRALGPAAGALVATRETVSLDAAVDVRAFDRALAAGDPAAALAAWRAPILDGFDEEWAHDARQAHARRLGEALEQVAAAGDPAEAIGLTREQVALDPLAAEPARRLIERLAQAGDAAAALAEGERHAEKLRAALGIAPAAATRALLDELRRSSAARVAPPRALGRVHGAAFVGRRAELERLQAAWAHVRARRDRRLVLLGGEPGIGKTRLAHELAGHALAAGATVLLGRCSEEPLAPFEPFAEALGQAGAAGVLQPLQDGAAGARHRLFDGVDAVLAAHAPLVLILDDLHWADRGSLLLARFLLRSPRPGPLLALGTYRDTDVARSSPLTDALADLQRDGTLERIAMRGLALGDVAVLARQALGADTVAGRVHARTGGNAFFVEEVLRGLADGAVSDVPESVRDAVGIRLARLGEDAGDLLAAAAILGLEQDAEALAPTAGLAPGRVEAALDEVLRARLLRPAAAPRRFEFAHALVRDAVLGDSTPCAAPAPTVAPPTRCPRWARIATSRRSRATASRRPRSPTRARPPSCSRAPGSARWRAWPTRTPRSASPARSTRWRSPARRPRPGRSCWHAGTRSCAQGSPPNRGRCSTRRRSWRAGAATAHSWARPRSASPGSASPSSSSTPTRSAASRSARDGHRSRPALAPAGAARRRALLRARPPPLGGAQRPGGRDRPDGRPGARARLRAQRPPRRTVATGPHRGAPGHGRGHDRGRARERRAPRRAAGAQLARDGLLRARRHGSLPRGDGPPRAARGGAAPARLPVVQAAVGGRRGRHGRALRAVGHLRAAIARNDELGRAVWRAQSEQWLARLLADDPAVATPA
jgi:DNA-binding SARP family transcriptional activator